MSKFGSSSLSSPSGSHATSLVALQDRLSKHLEVTSNRDRLMRFVMYATRVVALYQPQHKVKLEIVAKAMTDGRRLIRQGKYLGTFASLVKALQAAPAQSEKVGVLQTALPILQTLGLFFYFFLDQFVFLSRTGLIKLSNTDVLMQKSLQSWGISVIVKLIIDIRALKALKTSWTSPEGNALLLSIAKNSGDLPSVLSYLFPTTPINPYLLNISGCVAVMIDIYMTF